MSIRLDPSEVEMSDGSQEWFYQKWGRFRAAIVEYQWRDRWNNLIGSCKLSSQGTVVRVGKLCIEKTYK